MQIDLTPEQRDLIRHAVESGRVGRPEDAVQEAMALWAERERRRSEILTSVARAEASVARGEGIEITREAVDALADDVKKRGRARLAIEPSARR